MLSSVIALFRPVGMTTCLRGATAAAAIGLALLSAAGPAAAQDQPTQGDLRALIYYVESGDETAVQAELRRLRGACRSVTSTPSARIGECGGGWLTRGRGDAGRWRAKASYPDAALGRNRRKKTLQIRNPKFETAE